MARFVIQMNQKTWDALLADSLEEIRDARTHAIWLMREMLVVRGLLDADYEPTDKTKKLLKKHHLEFEE